MITIYSTYTGMAVYRVATVSDAWNYITKHAGTFYYQ